MLENVTFESGHSYFIVIDGWGIADKGAFSMCFAYDCQGDLNGDLVINIADLLLLLSGFSGQFDTADLLEFTASLGEVCD